MEGGGDTSVGVSAAGVCEEDMVDEVLVRTSGEAPVSAVAGPTSSAGRGAMPTASEGDLGYPISPNRASAASTGVAGSNTRCAGGAGLVRAEDAGDGTWGSGGSAGVSMAAGEVGSCAGRSERGDSSEEFEAETARGGAAKDGCASPIDEKAIAEVVVGVIAAAGADGGLAAEA